MFLKHGDYYAYTGQDSMVHVMETPDLANPREFAAIDLMPFCNWTITDLSYDEQSSSFLCSTLAPNVIQFTLSLEDEQFEPSSLSLFHTERYVYSCQLSQGGSSFISGQRGGIITFSAADFSQRNIRRYQVSEDVNSVRYIDKAENLILAGSDDGNCRVYDVRSQSDNPVQFLAGHSSGITYAEGNSSGTYVLSNSKDQTVKLWDLRNVTTTSEDAVSPIDFDYRVSEFPFESTTTRKDASLTTYRGHCVYDTLIRCHFSPVETTGEQYIYAGSCNNKGYIWSIDGSLVSTVDGIKCDERVNNPEAEEPLINDGYYSRVIIRDLNWHPQKPAIYASVGKTETGTDSGEVLYIPYNHRYEISNAKRQDWVYEVDTDDEGSNDLDDSVPIERTGYYKMRRSYVSAHNSFGLGSSRPLVRDARREHFLGYTENLERMDIQASGPEINTVDQVEDILQYNLNSDFTLPVSTRTFRSNGDRGTLMANDFESDSSSIKEEEMYMAQVADGVHPSNSFMPDDEKPIDINDYWLMNRQKWRCLNRNTKTGPVFNKTGITDQNSSLRQFLGTKNREDNGSTQHRNQLIRSDVMRLREFSRPLGMRRGPFRVRPTNTNYFSDTHSDDEDYYPDSSPQDPDDNDSEFSYSDFENENSGGWETGRHMYALVQLSDDDVGYVSGLSSHENLPGPFEDDDMDEEMGW